MEDVQVKQLQFRFILWEELHLTEKQMNEISCIFWYQNEVV